MGSVHDKRITVLQLTQLLLEQHNFHSSALMSGLFLDYDQF